MTKAITTDTKLDTTTTTQNMEDKKSSGENSKESATTGSPRTGSPTKNPGATGNIEDIWKKESGPESLAQTMGRRRNGLRNIFSPCADALELSSDDEIDEGSGTRLGNGESKAGFISRRPSMTAELETRMRQVRLSEGSDPHGQSGPSSPSATSKWGLYGMNWNTQSTILGDRNTTPPQQDLVQPPISPLARFQHSPFDPPVPRQLSPTNTSQPFSPHSRFPPPPTATAAAPLDPNQRVQRSQSFSLGDHSYGATYSVANAPVGHRPSLFADDKSTTVGTRSFKPSSAFPASPLARDSIEEEVDDFDATLRQATSSKDDSPSRYQDRGRSLSTSAASHAFTRQRGSEAEDLIDEALYEEDEEAEQEFEPLSRSRTLPTEHNMSGTLPGGALGAYGGSSRFAGLANTERERLERQRAPMRQSPRIVEDIPPVRRQDSFSQAAWDSASAVRSPPRSVDYPGVASNFDSFEQSSMVDSPGSMHSFPGVREYAGPSDVQNYFNNDLDRRRQAEHQMQLYQMQNRFRSPVSYPPHDGARPFSFHDPDQYTLHFVKFKANRMDVFYLAKEKKLDLQVKDYVIVDGDRGTDLGMVSKVNVTEAEARALTAQLQREQAAATAANQNGMNANAIEAIAAAANQVSERDVTIPKKFIHRLAVRGEIDGLQMKMQDEAQAKQVCEMKVQQRGLQMDILDVEYQWYSSLR